MVTLTEKEYGELIRKSRFLDILYEVGLADSVVFDEANAWLEDEGSVHGD